MGRDLEIFIGRILGNKSAQIADHNSLLARVHEFQSVKYPDCTDLALLELIVLWEEESHRHVVEGELTRLSLPFLQNPVNIWIINQLKFIVGLIE
jgi:hypothetical protein